MSGHSKWSSIKHQKGAADAKRGQLFTKLGHAITIAARLGGGNPAMNPRLTLAIDMAKKANMPKENVERAIKRGTGEGGGAKAEEIIYEGYGPSGTAILIEALTDNRNRTVNAIRAVFNKHNGNLGESGSVGYLFKQLGVLTIDSDTSLKEDMELAIIEAGALDYQPTDNGFVVYTEPKNLFATKEKLEAAGAIVATAEQRYEPDQLLTIDDAKTAKQIIKLITTLEELEDVTNVASNFELGDQLTGATLTDVLS